MATRTARLDTPGRLAARPVVAAPSAGLAEVGFRGFGDAQSGLIIGGLVGALCSSSA
ncbi:MAG TPA: hypothetical protein VET27_25425 [Mycobacterium sp.]|nr:hypothetical protein [Mycobacterium sp.]